MSRTRNYSKDKTIIEYFQLGYTPADTYREIKKSITISKRTIERMYDEWESNGREGEKVLFKKEKLDDGTIVLTYKDKNNVIYTGMGHEL